MNDSVKKIILKAIEEYNYSSIILFGSRARSNYSESSDYDLLIIFEDMLSIQEMRRIQMNIRKKLALQGIDADVLVRTRNIVEEYQTKKGNVIYNAIKEGIQL